MTTPLPPGFRITIDPGTKRLDHGTLSGGSPGRVVRLSDAGVAAYAALRDGPVATRAAGILARRLTDGGLAHPVPPAAAAPEVTVIVPVRDRAELLDRCLAALDRKHPVLVVDDASTDRAGIADVAARHGATLVRRDHNGGPGAARNTGLTHATTDLVAFLDSDCVAPPGWVDTLAAHFADPLVAAVAPRITALPSTTSAGRYGQVAGSLDLGDRPARVVPGTRVAYVPTAALLVRRPAPCTAFDPALRYGEDVDLVWRLHADGGRVRYDPTVRVAHHEPTTWPALLRRRFEYGTSAGQLALRHPRALAPLVLLPWPTVAVAGLLGRKPLVAGLAAAAATVDVAHQLHKAGVPPTGAPKAALTAVHQTWLGVGRYGTQFAAPLLVAALTRRGWGRRAAIVSLLLGRPLSTWLSRRPDLDPVRFTIGAVADDVAYGCGVVVGSVRARTIRPLRPTVVWRRR